MATMATTTSVAGPTTAQPTEMVGEPWDGWEMVWSKRFAGFYGYHRETQMVTRVFCDRGAVRRALERGEIETVGAAKKRLDPPAAPADNPRRVHLRSSSATAEPE